jgi:hypothetical protein
MAQEDRDRHIKAEIEAEVGDLVSLLPKAD